MIIETISSTNVCTGILLLGFYYVLHMGQHTHTHTYTHTVALISQLGCSSKH